MDERAIREALEPVLHWYQSDEGPERDLTAILRDVVEDLEEDRADNLRMRRQIQDFKSAFSAGRPWAIQMRAEDLANHVLSGGTEG